MVRGGTLWTVTGEVLENCDVLVENGRIKGIGSGLDRSLASEVIDAGGRVVTPGLIDCHSHLGLWEEGYPLDEASGNEKTDPLTPQLRALDGFDPEDTSFSDARSAGITTVQILPGSANVMGGQGVVVKTHGLSADEMIRRHPSGMKAAFGENPKNIHKERKAMPTTRMAVAAMLRSVLVEGSNYGKRREMDQDCPRDLRMEGVLSVLNGEMPLRIHAHRADDILSAIRVAEEFGLDYTIEHCTEGHKIARILGEKRAMVAFGPFLIFKSKLELQNCAPSNVVPIHEAGAHVSLTCDYPMIPISCLMVQAAQLVRSGLSREDVFRFVTINPAEHLGVSGDLGSLEVGKIGDLVVWKGDPFDGTSSVDITVIDGEVVYRR